MSIDPKFGRYCDECGKTISSAVRIHQGKDYCRSCYASTFVKAACTKCHGSMRIHRHATTPAVCNVCIRSERTCLRCGRFILVAGKLVGSGAVCNSCAPHFREKQLCSSCGRLSSRLSRPLFAGIQDSMCDSCRSKLTHATCSICNRYRPIQGQDRTDRPHCSDCAPGEPITHQCPDCGSTVNGGGLGRCIPCINARAIRRDAEMTSARLERDWTRKLWSAFVEDQIDLGVKSPGMRKRIANAAEFFVELEQVFPSQENINGSAFAERIDSKMHRKYLLASRFLVTYLHLEAFDESREIATERRRTEDILARNKSELFHGLLEEFAAQLARERTALRTVRLYLRAAEVFCVNAYATEATPWSESALVAHLKHFPGSANSLSRFVSHCKVRYGWDVQMPEKAKWKDPTQKTKKTLTVVKAALRHTSLGSVHEMPLRAVTRLLSAAMGVPASRLLEPAILERQPNDNNAIFVTEDGLIEPGSPLHPFARRWMDLIRRRTANRNSDDGLSTGRRRSSR